MENTETTENNSLLYVGLVAAGVALVCAVLLVLCYMYPLHMPTGLDILSDAYIGPPVA